MEDLADMVTACVVALASASYAQFGVRLERIPAPRAVHAVSPRRLERAAYVVARTPAGGSRAC